LLASDIAGVGTDREGIIAELGASFLQGLRIRAGDRHAGPLLPEGTRRLQPDTAGAARDQKHACS
jgi:hypothetical protein